MVIDFHSHILPGIDDGSKSVQESLAMLQQSAADGITHMVATPHFYASEDSPEHFLRRRQAAWTQLQPLLEPGMPQVLLGAEVYYFEGISYSKALPQLCVEDTDVLLLEMPFSTWTDRMIRDVSELGGRSDVTVVLAHIDRYLRTQSASTWETLLDSGILMQINASAVLHGWMASKKILNLIGDGLIYVIGSDCHNMGERRPNLAEALKKMRRRLGQDTVDWLMQNAASLLQMEAPMAF